LVDVENKGFYEDLNVLTVVYFAFGKKALKRDKRMENILYLRILLNQGPMLQNFFLCNL